MTDAELRIMVLLVCAVAACLIWLQEDMNRRIEK